MPRLFRLPPLHLLVVPLLLLGSGFVFADTDDYRFDPVHTQVVFCTGHLGFSNPCGRLRVREGVFSFDARDFSSARVDVVIDLATLDLGDTDWESHVKSGEFLNIERYPTARFTSDRVEKTSSATGVQTGVIHGHLNLHGVTRKLDLPFTFNRLGVHPYTFKRIAGFGARLSFKRSDFGMDKFLAVVSDSVELRIEVEGWRDRHAGEALKPESESSADASPSAAAETHPEEQPHVDPKH